MATPKFDETIFKPLSFLPFINRFFKDGCIYSENGKICFATHNGVIRIGNNIKGNVDNPLNILDYKIEFYPKLIVYKNNTKIIEEWNTGDKDGDRPWFDPLFDPDLKWYNKTTINTGLLTCRDGKTCYSFSISLKENEPIYGLGEHFSKLNKRGEEFVTWSADMPSTPNYSTYIPIPFIWSPRGWGLLVNKTSPVYFDIGKTSYDRLLIITRGYFDAYLFLGNVKEIFKNLYSVVGKPRNELPKWSFGFWQSKCAYMDQEEVLKVAEEIRKRKYPTDVIHIDPPWQGNWKKYQCDTVDYEWDRNAFPNPNEMIKKLHEMGFKLSLWINPYIEPNTKVFDKLKNNLLKSLNGGYARPLADCQLRENAAIPDLFNVEGFEKFKEVLKENVLRYADVIKADYGEAIPLDSFSNGLDGEELHNMFPLLYMKAVYESTKETKGYGIVWGRSGYTGIWQYPLNWGGDPPSTWEGLRQAIRGLLSFHSSGGIFASFDVGGFIGKPSEELYIRWLQAGIMVSHVRAHGNSDREPWKYNEEVTKKIIMLRYKLLPYIYSESLKAIEEEYPFVRPLFLDNLDDPNTFNIDDEFYLGDNILVAPITEEGGERDIYLPKGEYIEFFSEKHYEGNKWYRLRYRIDEFPIFIKSNSIIPMLSNNIDYINEEYFNDIEIHLYDVKDATYKYYDKGINAMIKCKNDCELIGFPNNFKFKFIRHPS